MSAFEELKALVGPPDWEVPVLDWVGIRDEIGFEPPADYRLLVESYPPFAFDNFLDTHHPGTPGCKHLQTCADNILEGARMLQEEFEDMVPYPLYPKEGGLYPWARTANSDNIFWRTAGHPDLWTIVVAGRSYGEGDWWEFAGSTTEFLVGVITRRVRCPALTEDFPGPDPVISQYLRDELGWD
ncbi:hypothetical protein [Actinomadura craniellae]|nr:hypothetical protein [Actinomadura craniellae]